jgi:hypothetical protein
MTYFNIPVTVCVDADTLEEAQIKAALFMPWTTTGSDWHIKQHENIEGWKIDHWIIDGLDSDELEGKFREMGLR